MKMLEECIIYHFAELLDKRLGIAALGQQKYAYIDLPNLLLDCL